MVVMVTQEYSVVSSACQRVAVSIQFSVQKVHGNVSQNQIIFHMIPSKFFFFFFFFFFMNLIWNNTLCELNILDENVSFLKLF